MRAACECACVMYCTYVCARGTWHHPTHPTAHPTATPHSTRHPPSTPLPPRRSGAAALSGTDKAGGASQPDSSRAIQREPSSSVRQQMLLQEPFDVTCVYVVADVGTCDVRLRARNADEVEEQDLQVCVCVYE